MQPFFKFPYLNIEKGNKSKNFNNIKEDKYIFNIFPNDSIIKYTEYIELIERHNRSLFFLALSILKNYSNAEDALQNAYLNSFQYINTLKNPKYFKTWLTRILINDCYKIVMHFKKQVISKRLILFGTINQLMMKWIYITHY